MLPVTLAAELDNPCVTFLTRAAIFPSENNPETPSDTSLTKPKGFPRKSTLPNILAACHFNSYNNKTHYTYIIISLTKTYTYILIMFDNTLYKRFTSFKRMSP